MGRELQSAPEVTCKSLDCETGVRYLKSRLASRLHAAATCKAHELSPAMFLMQGRLGTAVQGGSEEVCGVGPVCGRDCAAGAHAQQPHEHSQRHSAGHPRSGCPPERAQGLHQDLRGRCLGARPSPQSCTRMHCCNLVLESVSGTLSLSCADLLTCMLVMPP